MGTLLEQIKESGVKTGSSKAADITAMPHYMRNGGFYHIIGKEWEMYLIKGVYKDNAREIKGKCPYDRKTLNAMAQMLADTERNLRQPVILKLYEEDGKFYVSEAEAYIEGFTNKRDPQIKSPLTPVERSLGKGDMIIDKHLFIRAPFAEITPEVLSPAAMSFFAAVPDVLNPLFISCSIKTQSPSIKLLFGRLYMNMANADTIIPAFKQTSDFFMLNYAPLLFRSVKKPSFGIPEDSDLKISDAEIEEAVEDTMKAISDLKPEDLFTDDFAEMIALLIMTWEMIYIRLWKSFTSMHKMLGKSIDDTLTHIYKTRKDTLLNKDIDELHETIDPASPYGNFNGLNIEHLSIEEMYKTLGSAKRLTTNKGKYTQKIENCHRHLAMRDELYIIMMKLTSTIRSFLNEYGKKMVEDSMLTNADDIFCFELKEIENIVNDHFYGNIPFTTNFRKWQGARFESMCMPYNIYERDVEEAVDIADKQIESSISAGNIGCLTYFHKEIAEPKAGISRNWSLYNIKEAVDKDVIVSEAGSIFSHIAEYCACTDKPLYSGARFAEVLLADKKATFEEGKILFK